MSNQTHVKNLPLNDLIRISDVLKELGGISRATFFELRKRPDFPTAYYITSKLIVFKKSEIYQWVGRQKSKPVNGGGCVDNVHLHTRKTVGS